MTTPEWVWPENRDFANYLVEQRNKEIAQERERIATANYEFVLQRSKELEAKYEIAFRQLERALAAVTAERDAWQKSAEELVEEADYLKRVRRESDAFAIRYAAERDKLRAERDALRRELDAMVGEL